MGTLVDLTPPKNKPSWLSPWGAHPQNWRRSFLKGKKPRKKEYWNWSLMNPAPGWGWHALWYRLDMEDYLKGKT